MHPLYKLLRNGMLPEDIQPEKEFLEELIRGWDDQLILVVLPAISRSRQNVIHEVLRCGHKC